MIRTLLEVNIHDAAARTEILACLASLRPDATPTWGSLTSAGMLFHVNAGMRMALGELAAEPVDNPAFWHTRGKAIALSDQRWPEGAPTSKEALPGDDVDFDREHEQFCSLLNRIAETPLERSWPVSPRFGPMTGEEWSRLTYTHIRHHLRQFGIWNESFES